MRTMISRNLESVHLLRGIAIFLLAAANCQAAFHFWSISEIYSSADGQVQFVEFSTASSGQEFLNGQSMSVSGPLGSHSYSFPSNLPTGTANKTFIVGTSNLTRYPGGLRPDYIFTSATPFLFLNTGATNTVTLNGAATPSAVYTNLPTDGTKSLGRTGSGTAFSTAANNSPKNYFGAANSIVPPRFSAATQSSGIFVMTFATATGPNSTAGSNYAVEARGTFDAGSWSAVSNVTGNGTVKTVAIPISESNSFFRLRVP